MNRQLYLQLKKLTDEINRIMNKWEYKQRIGSQHYHDLYNKADEICVKIIKRIKKTTTRD